MKYLAIRQCPSHRDYYSVNVEDDDTGERVTPSKCCGRWDLLRRWPIDDFMRESILNALEVKVPLKRKAKR